MPKTKIEWCDYTLNPVKGKCPMGCPYCYALRMYDRFKWNPEIRFLEEGLEEFRAGFPDKPCRVFVGSTMELFGDWIKDDWLQRIFAYVKCFPYHTFIFLTKQPQNLIKWSPFPENCWVGVTATNAESLNIALWHLFNIQAKHNFVSLEPLLSWKPLAKPIVMPIHLDWLIIGAQTNPYKPPKIEWVREIVEAADKARIPVFLKNNLEPLLGQDQRYKKFKGYDGEGNMLVSLRQEMPIDK